jgi:hypothetical protein
MGWREAASCAGAGRTGVQSLQRGPWEMWLVQGQGGTVVGTAADRLQEIAGDPNTGGFAVHGSRME